jgi:threonylcarbamoyladenosine tRNA methylthiotransferase MtaB
VTVRVFLQTFGCRANQYDSEALASLIGSSDAVLVDDVHSADVAVFNSCAVTSAAEADLRQQVRRAARVRPELRTIVMGCAAARSATQIAALPGVSHVIGGADLPAISAAIGITPSLHARTSAGQRGTRGLLRIQDGCDEHCTFCATTLARGANRSRTVKSLLSEAQGLAAVHPEIVLTGIHIGTFGQDTGSSLGVLVRALVDAVPDTRFRLSSVEATEVDATLAELLTDSSGRVTPYLHAPLQSGSDRVLRRMGRHWYTANTYEQAISTLLSQRTVFGLGADVIAGFPGETDDDHTATVRLVERLPFTSLHVFPYSARPGTAATRFSHEVPASVARERAAELRALASAKAAAYEASRVGGHADVVVIGHDDGNRDGLTEDYLRVALSAPAPPRSTRFRALLSVGSDSRSLIASPIA